MYNSHLLLSFALFLFVAFSASGAVAPAHHNERRQSHLAARQTPGQEETRTRGCPFDGASCVLIEPKGDSSRKPEVRCGYLGSTRS
ncbi:hypothetical protein CSAL01_02315 [Colletotrichum salicis]|uniref:Secreted protein n=1 Tax=Colletotrichum salicis TaxID=1209931 RepID=A0A135V2Q7_9PEZI|nr:hypothetical protein CSAL01_02315 [Colletotrichum salicis]